MPLSCRVSKREPDARPERDVRAVQLRQGRDDDAQAVRQGARIGRTRGEPTTSQYSSSSVGLAAGAAVDLRPPAT